MAFDVEIAQLELSIAPGTCGLTNAVIDQCIPQFLEIEAYEG